jgi:hypothetical protein
MNIEKSPVTMLQTCRSQSQSLYSIHAQTLEPLEKRTITSNYHHSELSISWRDSASDGRGWVEMQVAMVETGTHEMQT